MKCAVAVLGVFIVGTVIAQRPTRPTPLDPRGDSMSTCNVRNMMCPEGNSCQERRMGERVFYECVMRSPVGESCPRTNFTTDRVTEEDDIEEEERVILGRAEGGRDRLNVRPTEGVISRQPCAEGAVCMKEESMCRMQPDTECTRMQMQQSMGEPVRCEDNGMFSPLQCRHLQNSRTLQCGCVFPMNGSAIEGTVRMVTNRSQVPDCLSRSFQGCMVRRGNNQMIRVRHGDTVLRRNQNMCQRCTCTDGEIDCIMAQNNVDCSRVDPTNPRSCMMDGEEVMHGMQREDGSCNRCGCRDGELQCTRIRECRQRDDDDGDNNAGEGEREREDRECDECRMMQRSPVCDPRGGRTFPSMCHAMRCNGLTRDDLEMGPCSERDTCSRESMCPEGTLCQELAARTRTSRENNRSELRRICIDRMALRCLPTNGTGDERRLAGDDDMPDREGTDTEDVDDDDRRVCASDGNTYPSVCHMMLESRSTDRLPRIRFPGRCGGDGDNEDDVMVCGNDGVTYENERAMFTRGGNIRMDYMGACVRPERSEDNTPEKICQMAKDNRCPMMTNCTKRVQPSDGCCPICGGAVQMIVDQRALDEHVRGTGMFGDVDELMGSFMQPRGNMGHIMPENAPIIPENATMRCEVTMTRPATSPGNVLEVTFKARNMSADGEHCYNQAMMMRMRANDNTATATVESSLVVAAATAPAIEDETGDNGAPAFVASSITMFLLAASTMFFF